MTSAARLRLHPPAHTVVPPVARRRFAAVTAALLLLATLPACNPTLNWREVRGGDAPYSVLLPAKPSSHTRTVDLGGLKVELSMTAAEADDVSYAVASARVPDASQRKAALAAMQAAMLRNIGSEQHQQRAVVLEGGVPAVEVVAAGRVGREQRPVAMHARFAEHGERVYQAVALGPKERLSAEAAETFLSSFKTR